MRYSACKEIDAAVKRLVSEGWSFKWGKKHGRLGPPSGGVILTVPKSPSDWRAALNFQRDIRHATSRENQVSSAESVGGLGSGRPPSV